MIIELRKGGAVTMSDTDFSCFVLEFSRMICERDTELAADDTEKRIGMLRRDVVYTNNSLDFVDIAVYSTEMTNSYNLVYQESVEIHGWRFK